MEALKPGVYTALVTLTKGKTSRPNNPVDFDRTKELIDHQAAAGVTGIVLLGTTGQSATIDGDSRKRIITELVPYVQGKGMIPVVGCGSNATNTAIKESKGVERLVGPDVPLLHVTGYYNLGSTQEGITAHFNEVAPSVKNPIILYNVPGRTGSYMRSDTVLGLAHTHGNIVGLKQAVDFNQDLKFKIDTKDIIETAPKGFSVYSGEDPLVAAGMEMGMKGVISATANIRPHEFVEIVNLSLDERFREAQADQIGINPVVAQMFAKKNPIPLHKTFDNHPRLPLTLSGYSADDTTKLAEVLNSHPSPDPYFNKKV